MEDLEKITEEIQMKEQRMIKRYERFVQDTSKVEEEVRKRNEDKKAQAELESVQKIQHYQKQANMQELGLLDKIVK